MQHDNIRNGVVAFTSSGELVIVSNVRPDDTSLTMFDAVYSSGRVTKGVLHSSGMCQNMRVTTMEDAQNHLAHKIAQIDVQIADSLETVAKLRTIRAKEVRTQKLLKTIKPK